MLFDLSSHSFTGSAGALNVAPDDEVAHKLAMLIEGECLGLGPDQAAAKFGYSKQRYYQLRAAFVEHGSAALQSHKRGPKACSRRTDVVVREVIRHRFLDPNASADVIAQKIRQSGWVLSTRSVGRVFADFGLQKKTP